MIIPSSRIPYLPTRIEGLASLAMNLWWSWSRGARLLFRSIDPPLWHRTRHNPLELLCRVDPARIAACASDSNFLRRYDDVMARMAHETTSAETWFKSTYKELDGRPVAYFCAEFGLHSSVPIYSGGLGILAGDHCKSASDLGIPMVGVGLFYRKGYFDQRVRLDGWQEDSDVEFDLGLTPLQLTVNSQQEPYLTTVTTWGREVHVRAFRMMVGRVPLYLLDTNLDVNHPDDRALMNNLYSGSLEMRLRQEWILGVGGVRVLRALEIDPAVWHANEATRRSCSWNGSVSYAPPAYRSPKRLDRCAHTASSRRIRRCPQATTPSPKIRSRLAPVPSGTRWESPRKSSSTSASIRRFPASFI